MMIITCGPAATAARFAPQRFEFSSALADARASDHP